MAQVEVKLLRPLNGEEVGSVKSYDEADVKRLERRGAVERTGEKLAEAFPALSSMTKDELIAQAEREGVDLSDASNNDERRSAIEAARG